MNNPKLKYKELIRIISEVTGVSRDKLGLDTTINLELGIYGDDWDELMNPIIDKYPINEHSEFEFSRHMRPEGDLILAFLLEVLLTIPRLMFGAIIYPFNKMRGNQMLKKKIFGILKYENQPLYIADIYNSIMKGKWEYATDTNLDLKELIK